MRTKTLLFLFLLTCGVLNAQDTIRSLVITECRLDDARHSYIEVTNMGSTTLNLANFEVGVIGAWEQMLAADKMSAGQWYSHPANNYYMMLPNKQLAPGKSFVIAGAYDWDPEQYLKAPDKHNRIMNKKEFWTLAGAMLHFKEAPKADKTDSITDYYRIMELWNGRECLYVRYHFINSLGNKDSIVTDQVNGIFTGNNNTRPNGGGAWNVAGMSNATNEATLVRKYSVTKGNLDFKKAAGTTLAESEWMPIPLQLGHWEMSRKLFWTAGTQTNTVLDATTFTSSVANIDFTNGTITVPWGTRKDDSVMMICDRKDGLAWHYFYNDVPADSLSTLAKTGDTLTVYACGENLMKKSFRVVVAAPTASACVVAPRKVPNEDGFSPDATNSGYCAVSDGNALDTISSSQYVGFGITFGTRSDSLLKYLDKAPNASMEIVWKNDESNRVDLVDGDKLKVTAEDGTVKEYYIKVNKLIPSHDSYLSSITWPDIPSAYINTFGWNHHDTLPNFTFNLYNYTVTIPLDYGSVPALVGKTRDINSTVDVQRATNLMGSTPAKTATFIVTAQDDTTINTYKVILEKEQADIDIQPWAGAPFFSQWVWNEQWANNFLEVVNPGNVQLDLSDYMFAWGYTNTPAEAITRVAAADNYGQRYQKYIPGYKWQDSAAWILEPAIAEPDPNISPLVAAGDVFVMGDIRGTGQSGAKWFAKDECDILFNSQDNPWHQFIDNWQALNQWDGANYYLFHIDNDSIKAGLKAAKDPSDYTLIDVIGSGTGTAPKIGGVGLQQINGFIRKPEIFKGNPVMGGSFGTTRDSSEWLFYNRDYYDALGVGWPQDILYVAKGLGSHYMYPATIYRSTIVSDLYKVSTGFVDTQSIEGVLNATTVDQFLSKIVKIDTGQTLTVINAATKDTIQGTTEVLNKDLLAVRSADGKNVTRYKISVTADGLDHDALLTSTTYTITPSGSTGTITGFEYGTKVKDIYDACTAPAKSKTYMVVNEQGAYVPFKTLNFDTAYVDVLVSPDVYFEVVAEDGTTKITYQLKPTSDNTTALVTSSVFGVDQDIKLISFVPEGSTVYGFLSNLIPCEGATMKVVDKNGNERLFGAVAADDILIVTAADNEHVTNYMIQKLVPTAIDPFIVSDIYAVDPVEFTVAGTDVNDKLTVTTFLANIQSPEGVTVKVFGADGVEKTGTAKLKQGDYVTASSNAGQVSYAINVIIGVDQTLGESLSVYPNPSRGGNFTLKGVQAGNRIQVTNIAGARVYDNVAVNDRLSIANQPNGVYFITVSDGKNVRARFKVVKE